MPQQPTPNVPSYPQNVLDQLREYKWKGIAFPVSKTHVTLAHDLVEHRFWSQDGANVEATGRAPLVISATIHFRNNLARGRQETWGFLYPTAFRNFFAASAERTTGTLEHPEFGPISCKLKSATISHDAQRRDGADVEASWVETREAENDRASFTSPSPAVAAVAAAIDLDANISNYTLAPPIPKTVTFVSGFAPMIRSITSIGDQVSLLSRQIGGQFAAINYKLNAMESFLMSTKSALVSPMLQSINRLRHATNGLQQKLLQKQRETRLYVCPVIKTLASLVIDLEGNTVNDLIKLNPSLVGFATVPARTPVRYYAPKLAV